MLTSRTPRTCVALGLLTLAACHDAPTATEVRSPDPVRLEQAGTSASSPNQTILSAADLLFERWIRAGIVTAGQGRSLWITLRDGARRIGGSPTGDDTGANDAPYGPLQPFVNLVASFMKSGILTPAQASRLTSLAHSLVSPNIAFIAVTTGGAHACGITAGGLAYCWGSNTSGQLGDGGTTARPLPVLVSSKELWTRIDAGEAHTCAIALAGPTWCWGANEVGQLGNGGTAASSTPTRVSGGVSFTAIEVSAYATCALDAAGTSYCWGPGGRGGIDWGGLASPATSSCTGTYLGTWPCALAPQLVSGGHTFAQVSTGIWNGCGREGSGQVFCWGWNSQWQLGTGTNLNVPNPVPSAVAGGMSFGFVATGAMHSCALDQGGNAYCWGGRVFNYGQIGNGDLLGSPIPIAVSGNLTFRSVRPSKGNNLFPFTCGVTTSEEAYCWGDNQLGEIGNGGGSPLACNFFTVACELTPAQVAGGLHFRDVATGGQFACGVTTSDEAYCWGGNSSGQLGNGTTNDTSAPTRVKGY